MNQQIHPISVSAVSGESPLGKLILLLAVLMTVIISGLRAQCLVDRVYSAPDTKWIDMAFYRSGGKLFVADNTNSRILVFDAANLQQIDEIELGDPPPQNMALHEGSGQLFVVVDLGWATSDSKIVVINADTHQIRTTLTGLDRSLMVVVDENRSRLYSFGDWNGAQVLACFDVQSLNVLGSEDIGNLIGEPHSSLTREGGINPVTGELLFVNRHAHRFAIVDPVTLTGIAIDAVDSRGWVGIWNHLENKAYITTVTWGGYFSYDRDTGTPGFAGCVNDGTYLFFNERTNRIYTSAEIDGNTVIIEGPTDACQEIEVGGGMTSVGFATTKRHVYFVSYSYVNILDEDMLTSVAEFPIPMPGGGAFVSDQVIIDPATERVFIRTWKDATEGEGSVILAVDDRAPLIVRQPEDQTVLRGGAAMLSIEAAGVGTLHYQWYLGMRGDTSHPVGSDSSAFTTPDLFETTPFWVRISDDLGLGASREALVTVDPVPGTWAAQASGITRELNAVFFVDGNTGWAAGDRGTICKTTDGGAHWIGQTSGTTCNLESLFFINSNVGWAVGDWDTILKTTDGGDTWNPQESGTLYIALKDVTFVNSQKGWIAGASGTFLQTIDGGDTWSQAVDEFWDWLYDVSFADPNNGWTVGYGGVILSTMNGGETWSNQDAATVYTLYDTDFPNSQEGVIVGETGRIFQTTDGGNTWMRRAAEAFSEDLFGVDLVDDNLGWAVGNAGRMIKTIDGGTSWFPVSSGISETLRDVCFVDATTGWAVGDDGTILKFTRTLDPADLNGDNIVDSQDLALLSAILVENLLSADGGMGDINNDGVTNVLDLLLLHFFIQ